MKWLKFSSEEFEPIPDIQVSIKKPLFAASFVLRFTQTHGHASKAEASEERGAVRGFAELQARIPLRGPLHYSIEALSSPRPRYAFSFVRESDERSGRTRETQVRGDDLVVDGKAVEVTNHSGVPILTPLLVLPAFLQTHSSDEPLYGAHLLVGRRLQALRLERHGPSADKFAQTKRGPFTETYIGKLAPVSHVLEKAEWNALPWESRSSFEFDWNIETRKIEAARIHIPILGKIEIKT